MSSTCLKKIFIEESCTNNIATRRRKSFFQLLHLKVCELFLFRRNKKTYISLLWFGGVLFGLLEKRRLNKYFLRKVNIIFCMHIFSLMYQSADLFWKIANYNAACVFSYFCGGHRNTRIFFIRNRFIRNLELGILK